MKKEQSVNMSDESSAHNEINKIVLRKKRLDIEEENAEKDENNSKNGAEKTEQNNNENTVHNTNINANNNNNNTNIPKETYNNQKFESSIVEKRELPKNTKPSVLIIFIILVVIFGWELISDAISKKKDPEPNNNTINENIDNSNDEPNDYIYQNNEEIDVSQNNETNPVDDENPSYTEDYNE